ncbi:uncharacterized protein LOC109843946 isoform X2 [Asparagus officinalis]|uniref:uncharacterized protein LOC109843946 isoform X2 n=1 Tax=Asparagus officinalis TaxID=4686 RepID=UPI00098E407E|nr:uncharacterized protein LOC109843946 isoform X2 [Asparagus officinalis]
MAASKEKISLKLLIDKQQSRVVFAESDKDFLDILLSFLTMPTGTVIRLLGQDSLALGCITNVYKSVEGLDSQVFETEACKSMLLNPLNAAGLRCENLAVNVDDKINPRTFFTCPESDCCSKATCYYSSVPNVRCSCGKEMSYAGTWEKRDMNAAGDGVFVRGDLKFIISDELRVMPASTAVILSLFSKHGITDGRVLEERIVDIGRDEEGDVPKFLLVPKCEGHENSDCEEMKVKLLRTKYTGRFVYMECDEKVVELLFSFLILPVGAVIKFLGENSSMGCFDNLYESIETLCSRENVCIKSDEHKAMLLSPKLAPFFAAKMQILKIEETVSRARATKAGCYSCFRKNTNCPHKVNIATCKELNPKFPNKMSESGGGYAKGQCKFMVTDDLDVSLFSPLAAVHMMKDLGVSIGNLKEEEVGIGETQALNLLKAALCSETALTKVFSSNKRRRAS